MDRKTYKDMKYRKMGNSGLWVSEIGLGLWKWGDPTYDGSRVGEHEGFEILDRALEFGVTHWDTANSYNMGSGNSERLLGRYFASRGQHARDNVILATKIRNPVREAHELKREFSPNSMGSSRRYIFRAIEECLERLHTDWIDILYHHGPDLFPDRSWETPLDETWDALNSLVSQGKVRYLAVSNRTIEQLEQEIQALAVVASNPSRRIIAVQNGYNLLQRPKVSSKREPATLSDEKAFLDYAGEKQIGLVPYIPLAVGLLTGRYRKDRMPETGRLSEKGGEAWREEFLTDRNLDIVEELMVMAEEKHCTLAQLAIAWLLSHDVVCSVIAGVTSLEHLEGNIGSIHVTFTSDELEKIDRLTR